MGARLPYDSLDDVRGRLAEVSPALVAYGEVQDNNYFAQARALAQVCDFFVFKRSFIFLTILK